MTALNFPANPSNGDEFEGYVYDSTLGVWNRKPSTVAYTVSPSAPTNPNDGDVWFNEQDGSSYIYYVDGDSEQWVEIGGKVGATGATGANGADGADGRFVNSATKPSSAIDGDVWFNTNNGKIFVYYDDGDTSQWVESGSRVLAFDTLANLSDTNISSPVDGQALVYDSSSSKWVPGNAAPSGVNILNSDSINLDFSDNVPLEQRAVAGDVTFTASNYSAGAKKTIYLEGDSVSRSLTFPTAWNFITDKPTAIGADKKNILDLNSFGTSESTTVAIWLGASSFEPIVATGGTVTEILISGVTWKLHTFTTSGNFSISDLGTLGEIEYLIVAGGGGGGRYGAGGAGGVVSSNSFQIQTEVYAVSIGSGGTGSTGTVGTSGTSSSAFSQTAIGGGFGSEGSQTGGTGGSGGGGGYQNFPAGSGTFGQGFAGGTGTNNGSSYSGGGGGGGGGAGGNASVNVGGNGGVGFFWNITGTYYAGGGGGSTFVSGDTRGQGGLGGGGAGSNYGANIAGSSGTNGLGGGGGGGANGGSGIVIAAYPITDPN